MINLNTN